MIIGLLAQVEAQKATLPAAVVRAIDALQKLDLAALPAGRHVFDEGDGDKLFFLIQDVELRTFAESRPEAHNNYADIQIPLNGRERYGYAPSCAGLATTEDRLSANDVAFYAAPANESFIDLEAGSYAVFLPTELHRPCLAIGEKTTIRKAVVKIRKDLLGL